MQDTKYYPDFQLKGKLGKYLFTKSWLFSGQLNQMSATQKCVMFTEKAFVRGPIQPDKLPLQVVSFYLLSRHPEVLTPESKHTCLPRAYFSSKPSRRSPIVKLSIDPNYVCSNFRLKESINLQYVNPPIVQCSAK